MKLNMGNLDRFIRLIVGLFLISLIFWGPQTYWGLIGLIPLLTAVIGFCPLYVPFKFSTRKEKA
ncbi:MAG: DUF2892 domain-containing protein [Calditrichota bacterium]